MRVATIGFTRKTAEEFFTLVRDAGVKRIVDVRLNNVSQLAGFAKRADLEYFARELCAADYVHIPELAPTKEMLDAYKKGGCGWEVYAAEFTTLMRRRRIEDSVPQDVIADGCLLCSEHKPHHCHRRLVAEYLAEHWGALEVTHLG